MSPWPGGHLQARAAGGGSTAGTSGAVWHQRARGRTPHAHGKAGTLAPGKQAPSPTTPSQGSPHTPPASAWRRPPAQAQRGRQSEGAAHVATAAPASGAVAALGPPRAVGGSLQGTASSSPPHAHNTQHTHACLAAHVLNQLRVRLRQQVCGMGAAAACGGGAVGRRRRPGTPRPSNPCTLPSAPVQQPRAAPHPRASSEGRTWCRQR